MRRLLAWICAAVAAWQEHGYDEVEAWDERL
jgi:hypothetical protein